MKNFKVPLMPPSVRGFAEQTMLALELPTKINFTHHAFERGGPGHLTPVNRSWPSGASCGGMD
jgi:hypothetical protein